MIREVDIPNLIDLTKSIKSTKNYLNNNWNDGYFVETSSARASVAILMNYLLKSGFLNNRYQMILMPKWLCNTFVQTLRNYTNPVLSYNQDVKIVLIYHQYGYPQNMDEIIDFCDRKKIMIIEDCAHAISGSYKNMKLGRFGYASVYSFSKFFPSIWGGGLFTKNKKLYNWAGNLNNKKSKPFLSYLAHLSKFKLNILSLEQNTSKSNKDFWISLNSLFYPFFKDMQYNNFLVRNIINHAFKNNSLSKRIKNYGFILKYFENTQLFSSLEKHGVCPYVVPLIEEEKIIVDISDYLNNNGIKTGIYHFDINRNIFNPIYKKCVWLPIHEKVSNDKLLFICETVKKFISS